MRRRWLILALICIPVFIGSLDLTIVTAFLPEIIVKLELPVQSVINDAAWVVTGYLLAYTISMTFMGRVSDLVGRRRAYVICLIIFMIGSVVVAEVDPQAQQGLAGVLFSVLYRVQQARPDAGSVALITIVIGRVIQALGAGALVPVSLALVGDLFPAAQRAQPLGVIGAIDTLGWVLGHLYGGIMVQLFGQYSDKFAALFASLNLNWPPPDWRALFWINLPVSLIALVLTWWNLRGVQQEHSASKGRFDFIGTILIVGALTGLVLGLGANIETATSATQFSDIGGLPPYALPVLIAALVMFVLFIVVELRVRDPLFDLRIFRRRNISAGLATNLFVGCCLMIGLVSVPILVNIRLPSVSQLPQAALQVGILLSALTVPMALAAIPGGWLSDRIGYRWTAALGLGLALIGFAAMSQTWTLDVSDGVIAIEMALVGVGLGLTFSPISASVINTADQDKLGVASALVIIMRLLGMTISIAALTAFASQRLATLAADALGASTDPTAAIDIFAQLTIKVLAEMGLIGAGLCVLGLIPALMLRRAKVQESAEEQVLSAE